MENKEIYEWEEEGINLKKWIRLFFRYWVLFLVCILIAVSVVFILKTFSIPRYELRTQILVNKDNNPLDKAQLFSSAISYDPYQIENEKGILRSKSVTQRAIQQLNFRVSYYVKRNFKYVELYKSIPFSINIDTSYLQPLNVLFSLSFINDTLMIINAEAEEVRLYNYSHDIVQKQLPLFKITDTIKFGEITGNSYCRFSILPGFKYLSHESISNTYYFKFNSLRQLVNTFSHFRIQSAKTSSIISVTFQHENPQKAADFLNKLSLEYLKKGVDRDNKMAEATIHFIDKQLIDIVDSLTHSGERLQDFQSSIKAMDIDYQVEKVYTKLEDLEAKKAQLLVKKRYFNYLLENIQSHSDLTDLITPSSLEINDPVLNNLIIDLAKLYTERAELSFNTIKDNPYLRNLELRINETRKQLVEAVKIVLETTEIAVEEIETRILTAEQNLNRLPKDQQQLLNIERKFKLNDDIYTYLLTRRSEMEIYKASNIPVNEILDVADPEDAIKVLPNTKRNLIVSVLLGFLIPGILIVLRESLNYKIRGKEDIQNITKHPLIGQVIDSNNNGFPAVLREPNSVLTESYRTLRTNLQFIIDESDSNVLLVTSAIQGEGKSFTALNLASVYAFYGKKVIVLDYDLRKSKIKENLQIEKDKGLSNYLSRNASLKEVIYHSEDLNFDLITSGPIPPNPSELISSPETSELITKLKKKYDIILIDSPPLGIVSDALLIHECIDTTLFVVRFNYTSREVLENILDELQLRKIEKINIVLNDVIPARSYNGYGYGYGYNYGYSKENKSANKFWNRIFKN